MTRLAKQVYFKNAMIFIKKHLTLFLKYPIILIQVLKRILELEINFKGEYVAEELELRKMPNILVEHRGSLGGGVEFYRDINDSFVSAKELFEIGNKLREEKGLRPLTMASIMQTKESKHYVRELESRLMDKFRTEYKGEVADPEKYTLKAIRATKGRNGRTWLHPYLFIRIANILDSRIVKEGHLDFLYSDFWGRQRILFEASGSYLKNYINMVGTLYYYAPQKHLFSNALKKANRLITEAISINSEEDPVGAQDERDYLHLLINYIAYSLQDSNLGLTIALDIYKDRR